ncbi:DUF4062 domain-containing protein [Colwellia sp. BRX9-1]|uniref:DUF4062 domain-containing protein n=1 Tax=Colwellia sp. BRX9-1 TaxID=2759830 RepID=UPI0015F60FD8|nr:DUF4062 domain-containing protein [Colwellia sp. BRX9-1]MBA6352717.1 DUF4062 domain-containing protein [Colwellia sp. BRX9-1]
MHDDNREFRIFISSTFRDMHDERDMLNQKVFPEIRKICWERGVNFSPVDLRWGINSEETERGEILRICLDEVENSQPFFIGILGQRYGWIPDQGQSGLNIDEQSNLYYGIVSEALLEERSVTEMEIRYGMLKVKNRKAIDAFFYFKEEDLSPIDEPVASQAKLAQLKDHIRSWAITTDNVTHLLDGYCSLELLGRRVRADLLKIIENRWPENQTPSAIERERSKHLGFAQSRRQDYIADESSIAWIDSHLDHLAYHSDRSLVIWGPSGIGKSALLAEWVDRTRKRRTDVLIFEHYLQANSHISTPELLGRLLDSMNVSKNEAESAQQLGNLENYMRERLQAYNKPVVLVLDFNGNNSYGCFTNLPENVLVITTKTYVTDGVTLEVPLLDDNRRKQLIDKFSKRYRKQLDAQQIALINAAPQTRNPLFLKTLLDEIRLFGRLEARTPQGVSNEITALLENYLNSDSLVDLFERVIAYRENSLGLGLVEQVLSLIRVSLMGLTEDELYGLLIQQGLGCTPRDIIEVLRLFDPQLSYSGVDGGAYHFIHDAMDAAVWNRYKLAAVTGRRLELHALLADYFYNVPDKLLSARLRESVPYYLVESKQWQNLDDYSAVHHAAYPPTCYTDGDYLIGNLRRITNISHSKFLSSVRDSITVIMAEWDQENNIKTLFELNKQLYFTNKLKPIDGRDELFESLAVIIKEKGLDSYARYIQGVLPETSTVFYFVTTIERLLSCAPEECHNRPLSM